MWKYIVCVLLIAGCNNEKEKETPAARPTVPTLSQVSDSIRQLTLRDGKIMEVNKSQDNLLANQAKIIEKLVADTAVQGKKNREQEVAISRLNKAVDSLLKNGIGVNNVEFLIKDGVLWLKK